MEGQENNNQTNNQANNQNVEVNNATVGNQNNEILTPNEDAVKPLSPEVDNSTKSTPKTHVDAVSTNDEVEKSADLPSAKDADVGTKTNIEKKTTIKDRMLDGLPGIGVPEKSTNTDNNFTINNNANNTNSDSNGNVVQPSKEIVKEPVTFKKKVQYFFTTIFFILLALFIYFLPEITEYFGSEHEKEEKVNSGFLNCKLERNVDGVSSVIKDRFTFTDNKLKVYRRDRVLSANKNGNVTLSEANDECEALLEQTKQISGVDVSCSFKNKNQRTIQTIDYETVNSRKLDAAFTEAGGTNPEYSLDDDIDDIESTMKTAGFSCERNKD